MKAEKGSILLEGMLVLSLLVIPLVGFLVEAIRLSHYHVVLHQGAFRVARAKTFGEPNPEKYAFRAMDPLLNPRERRAFRRTLEFEDYRLRLRFPALFPVLQTRYQITKTCRPFGSD